MFFSVILCVTLALVNCQDGTTQPAHTHVTHQHTEPVKITDHNFSTANPVWYLDSTNHWLVMKTDSGCYAGHLNAAHQKEVATADGLLKLERAILHQVQNATYFTAFPGHQLNHVSTEIRSACPALYHYHHTHVHHE